MTQRALALRGSDHVDLGKHVATSIGSTLALCMSAGAAPKRHAIGALNEDAGAIAVGRRGVVLIVADAHFGYDASELAVDHVLDAIGPDPPPADLSGDELVALFFDAGVAVQRETTRPGFAHPNSRTTLALALVSDKAVQWASLGDSCVLLVSDDGCERVDVPRGAYLGQGFDMAEIAATLSTGRASRSDVRGVVLATDGLVDSLGEDGQGVAAVVAAQRRDARDARDLGERLVTGALARGITDAVTVAALVE